MQRRLESGWGSVLSGGFALILALWGLSLNQWRVVLVLGLLTTTLMLFNRRTRHYMLLPSCLTFAGGIVMVLTLMGIRTGF